MSNTPRTIEDRKQEMFAAQTLIGHLARRIYEAQRDGLPSDVVASLVEQKAACEATVLRLSHEISTETMSRNLLHFMDLFEAGNQKVLDGQSALRAGWEATAQSLKKDVEGLSRQIGVLGAQQQRERERLDAVIGRLGTAEETADELRHLFVEHDRVEAEDRRALNLRIDALDTALAAIQARLAASPVQDADEVAEMVGFIRRQMQQDADGG